MILIISADGGVQQHHHELTQEEIQAIDRGDFRAFKYDHVLITFNEASPDEQPRQAQGEGDAAPPIEQPLRTVTWQPVPR